MITLLLILGALCIWKLGFSGYHDDFLSQKYTTPIKGIFTVLILCSHIRGYLTLTDTWADLSYNSILDHLGQLIVAIFFFYSGYGIWESFRRKPNYVNSFFKNRFLKTLLHFDIAVAIFIIAQLFIPITYSDRQYLLCWIGWESVGNSNWFIFVILALYIIALISMRLQKSIGRGGMLSIGLLTAALWIWLRILMDQPSWWVDTMAAFPLGAVVSKYKDSIMRLLRKRGAPYIVLGAVIVLFSATYMRFGIDIYGGDLSLLLCYSSCLLGCKNRESRSELAWEECLHGLYYPASAHDLILRRRAEHKDLVVCPTRNPDHGYTGRGPFSNQQEG